jgi:phage terminase Nu1 subunit (DNA packaging protein)
MTKRKDVEVSAAELAHWLRISAQAVNENARKGVVERAPARGKYLLQASVRGYIRAMKAAAVGRENPTTTERTRLLKIQADSIETKFRALDAKLISASSSAATWSKIRRRVREQLLKLPDRIEARLPGRFALHDIGEIRKEALRALSPLLEDGEPNNT